MTSAVEAGQYSDADEEDIKYAFVTSMIVFKKTEKVPPNIKLTS